MCSNTQPWKEKQADGTENGAGRTRLANFAGSWEKLENGSF